MKEEIYAIVVKREKQEDYYLPMPLEQIDSYFTTYSKEQVLERMRQSDSVLTETNPELLSIKKYINGKFLDDKNTPIIEDVFDLTFPLELLPINPGDKFINVLLNKLEPLKAKKVSSLFKETIDSLKIDKTLFLEKFNSLSYSEKRMIRVIIIKNMNVKEYFNNLEKENNILQLSRTKEAA